MGLRREKMATKKSLAVALFTAAAIGGIVSCGGGGGGGGTTETTETQLVNNATQEEAQEKTATVTGTLPEDVQLADDADIRAVEGVADVVAICDGQTIDGYFTNGGKNFVVEVPVNQECVIAFVDRKITEGSNLPQDAKILAATPPIEVEKPVKVQIQITAIDNGIAKVQAPQDVVKVGNPEIVQNLVNKPLAEAVQEVVQHEEVVQTNGTQTAPAGQVVGNVELGWLDKRVVGFGVDKIVNDILDGIAYTNITSNARVGDYVYLFDKGASKVYAIDLKAGKKVPVEIVDIDGNNYNITQTNQKINAVLTDGNIAWVEEDDRDIVMYKLSEQLNADGKLVIKVYKTGKQVTAANTLNTTNFTIKNGELIEKNVGSITANTLHRFYYDEQNDKIVVKSISVGNYLKYIEDKDTIIAYLNAAAEIDGDGTNEPNDKILVITWDDTNKQYVIKYDSSNTVSTYGKFNAVNGIEYLTYRGDIFYFEAIGSDSTNNNDQKLVLIAVDSTTGQLKANKNLVTNSNNDADGADTIATVNAKITEDDTTLIIVNDINNNNDITKSSIRPI
jgi:hypothetical protein